MKGRKYKAMIRKLAKDIDGGFTTCSSMAQVTALSLKSLQKIIAEMTAVPKQSVQDGYQCRYTGIEIQSGHWIPINIVDCSS